MDRARARWALAAILLLAAALRFTGLSWGLRHAPHWDERVFVENAGRMAAQGDLDNRFYEYPGLLFLVLAPILAVVGPHPGAVAYLAARAVVAAFGVASVFLVFRLGSRMMGPRAGLAAALLLAVSPVDVWTAHMVRPDVVLQAFVLLAFLALLGIGERPAGDARAGAAMGAAAAVKFTGLLLAPSYVAQRLLAPGPRARGALAAGAAALAVVVCATPYAVLHHQGFARGVLVQWNAHYGRGSCVSRFGGGVAFYLRVIAISLGPVGAVLCVVGSVAAAREWRKWLPPGLFAILLFLTLATAQRRYDRLLVPALGVFVLLAVRGLGTIARGRPVAGWVAAMAAASFPLVSSAAYLRQLRRPSTWDRAVDFVSSQAPPGSRILSTERDLGLDRSRFEVVPATGAAKLDGLLARSVDLVVADPRRPVDATGLRTLLALAPERPQDGPPLVIYSVPDGARPRYSPFPLARARLSASEAADSLERIRDGRLDTDWHTAAPQHPGQWLQVDLPEAVVLGRLEVGLGRRAQRGGRDLHLMVTEDGQEWRRVRAASGRASVDEQPADGASDVFIVEPVRVRGLRLEQMGRSEKRWGIAELRLDTLPEVGTVSAAGSR